MKMLTSIEEFNQLRSKDLISLECIQCHGKFNSAKRQVQVAIKGNGKTKLNYCSIHCARESQRISVTLTCPGCKETFKVKRTDGKRRKFCSHACACRWQVTHKTKAIHRSKLEMWIEKQLSHIYPALEIHYCRSDTINGELDIYIPSLKLAFELNGVFHYEPIFGPEKLAKTQTNDNRKYQACIERGIELCIIDTSKHIYFKESTCKPYLDIITSIITKRLGGADGGS